MNDSRTLIDYIPFLNTDCGTTYEALWAKRGFWPARWITNSREQGPHMSAYRNHFEMEKDTTVRIHVSGDAVFLLYLDGVELLRGPEAGTLERYCFDTLDIELTAGKHTLCALVWCFGDYAPSAKISGDNGFILAAEGPVNSILNTNSDNWQGKILPGLALEKCAIWEVGPENRIDYNRFPENIEFGQGEDWLPPIELDWGRKSVPGIVYKDKTEHFLIPASLPKLRSTEIQSTQVVYVSADTDSFYDERKLLVDQLPIWQKNFDKGSFSVAPNSTLKILLRLDDYYCAIPVLNCSGGKNSSITIRWAEALYLDESCKNKAPEPGGAKGRPKLRSSLTAGTTESLAYKKEKSGFQQTTNNHQPTSLKGDRQEFLNRHFIGHSDSIICGGGENETLWIPWYRAGVFVELLIRTENESLLVREFKLRESRYPVDMEAAFECSDERLNQCARPMARTLQMCMRDTYMDCPYYEQMMYLGDTRLQMLLNYNIASDRRLAEKAIRLMLSGRLEDGLIPSRFPANSLLSIPTFSMLFAGIVNDYVRYVGDSRTLREILPRFREAMDSLEKYQRADGLIVFPDSWCFTDWVRDEWGDPTLRPGSPPESADGVSGIVNWTYVYALAQAAEAHEWIGESELAARYRRLGRNLAAKLVAEFYRPDSGLFADVADKSIYSEHGQCLALLSGFLPPEIEKNVQAALFSPSVKLTESTVYFSYYYQEVCLRYHRWDRFMGRMKLWFDMMRLQTHTVLESPEPSRSDCHAWSSHPLSHFFTGIMGIRPSTRGFRSVRIEPETGDLRYARASFPHPEGRIEAAFTRESDQVNWNVFLPENVTATFHQGTTTMKLPSGNSAFSIKL